MTDGRGKDEQAPPPVPPEEAAQPTPDGGEAQPEPDLAAAPVQVAAPGHWPLRGEPGSRRRAPGPQPVPSSAPPTVPPLPPAPAETRAAQPRKRRSIGLHLLVWTTKALAIFVAGSLLWVLAYRFIAPPVTLTMVGDMFRGRSIARQWMPLGRIDPVMARAAIAAEDSGFCGHNGFDLKAIEAAYVRNQRGGRIRGGSTISQQTAKNAFLWQGGGYVRKGLEAWFTFLIENLWGKRRIMEVYLNVAETGIATYGVNAGAMRYYGHDASRLTAREAAQMAAVLPLPKRRMAVGAKGFTRRYANAIAARVAVVRNEGLDACLR
jgi:monofunctional biosynthetic peptidoglycan transglycosylase